MRRRGRDHGIAAVTNGVSGGMSGWEWRALRRAWLAIAVLALCIDAVNVASTLQDHARLGRPLTLLEPVVWEYTSGFCGVLLAPLIFAAVRFAPPERALWRRFVVTHALASFAYSALHVGGMFALRALIYWIAGDHYHDSLASFPYEYRKDLVTYAIMAAAFWIALRLLRPQAAQPAPAPAATFDIRDGARLIRVPVADIVSVASAGNYVEFALADGRKPLMRTTLSSLEAQLSAQGLVRTHRSWLVNAGRVRAIEAEGSGDFTVELEGGVSAPLSRRFPQALARLRTAG
jgi:DNA-binding LytR/AlgR family response regulator